MKAGKKVALLFGVATGAAVALMAFGKTGKKVRDFVTKKDLKVEGKAKIKSYDDSEINYV